MIELVLSRLELNDVYRLVSWIQSCNLRTGTTNIANLELALDIGAEQLPPMRIIYVERMALVRLDNRMRFVVDFEWSDVNDFRVRTKSAVHFYVTDTQKLEKEIRTRE